MKLFSKEEMQRLEAAAEQAGVTLDRLMDRAGKALALEIEKRCRPVRGKRVVLLCGCGNNGGDGFVCAGVLSSLGACCTVVLVQGPPRTELAARARQALPPEVLCLDGTENREEGRRLLDRADVVADCVFGFGFRGELSGAPRQWLEAAGQAECLKVAADLPSGVECDTGRVSPGAFRAHVTVTFTGKKPAACSYPAKEYCGETVVRQVGVPPALLEAAKTKAFEPDPDFLRDTLRPLAVQSHKGDLGRLLLVCGSCGMTGACVMAARAALRCGVGLLHIAADRSVYPILAQAVPEAVFTVLDWERDPFHSREKLCAALDVSTACVIGCGLGPWAETLCPAVLLHSTVPLVLDADALNFCARHPDALEEAEAPLILTPHPGEMARLCEDPVAEIQADRLGAAGHKARDTGAVVVLKGAATVIAAADGRCAVNPSGNPGMAKGGSGDVLAGVIGSLAAQGVPPFEAAAAGAYLHGRAGDLCAQRLGMHSMLPTDLAETLPEVFCSL